MLHPVSSSCSLGPKDFFNGLSSCQSMSWWSLPEAGDSSLRTAAITDCESLTEKRNRNLTMSKSSVRTSFYKWPCCFPPCKCAILTKFHLKGSLESSLFARERISNTWSGRKAIHVLPAPHGSVSLMHLYHQPMREGHLLMSWSAWEHQVPVSQEWKYCSKACLTCVVVRMALSLSLYVP